MDAAAFVIRSQTDQIESFQAVVARIRDKLVTMPPEERQQIEEAGAILRRVRVIPMRPWQEGVTDWLTGRLTNGAGQRHGKLR